MAYGYDLATGLPPGGRPVAKLHIFDILDILNILTYNLGGGSDSSYFLGGVQICHIEHIGHIHHI